MADERDREGAGGRVEPGGGEAPGLGEETRPGRRLSATEARPEVEADYPAFRQLTFYSTVAGLCPLIPLPFVDDWALALVRRKMVRELARGSGRTLADDEVAILAGSKDDKERLGCGGAALWVVRKVVFKVLKKLFRTVFYFLALREGIGVANRTFHEGYLALHRLRGGPLGGAGEAWRVRRAIRGALARVDLQPVLGPIQRAFRGSTALLVRGAGILAKPFGKHPQRARHAPEAGQDVPGTALAEEEELLGGFVDRLAGTLWGHRAYLEGVERVFEEELGREGGPGGPGGVRS